jgi:hypothetical protein
MPVSGSAYAVVRPMWRKGVAAVTVSDDLRSTFQCIGELIEKLTGYQHALEGLYASGTARPKDVARAARVVLKAFREAESALVHFKVEFVRTWMRKPGRIREAHGPAADKAAELLSSSPLGSTAYEFLLTAAFLGHKPTIFYAGIFIMLQRLILRPLALPPKLAALRRKQRSAWISLGVSIVLLGLGFMQFAPIVSIPLAVVGVIVFFVQYFWVSERVVHGAEFPVKLATEAQQALGLLAAQLKVAVALFDNIAVRIPDWPQSVDDTVTALARGEKVPDEDLRAQIRIAEEYTSALLSARTDALRDAGLL